MGIFRIIQSLLNSKEVADKAESEPNNLIHVTATILRNCSSTCTCGGLAVAIQQQGNIYRCVRCDGQFANVSYNLGHRDRHYSSGTLPIDSRAIIDMDYYDDAIRLFKEEDKSRFHRKYKTSHKA